MKIVSLKVVAVLLVTLVVLASGCAQVGRKVEVVYAPLATFKGGTGVLELAATDSAPVTGSTASLRWVIGTISSPGGTTQGEVVSSVSPREVLADAFKQELSATGYQIKSSPALDKETKRGIVFTDVSVKIDEIQAMSKLESSCAILLKMDLWENGQVVKHSEYQSKLSDIVVMDRDLLSSKLYQKAIQDMVQQAVPDIVKMFK